MQGPRAVLLDGGERLHLHHGPIDLIVSANTKTPIGRRQAFAAANQRFVTVLEELVAELGLLRKQLTSGTPVPQGGVAQRMHRAASVWCEAEFVTPMIAVAGAVADEVLSAMQAATELNRAYVNNGGDIAVHLSKGQTYTAAISGVGGNHLGKVEFAKEDDIGGIATSGAMGRSHSFGIADSVTALAKTAAAADAAATLIANAVDLPGHMSIERQPASSLQPDSDLQERLVVTAVPLLSDAEQEEALQRGLAKAKRMMRAGEIKGAALFLQGASKTLGTGCVATPQMKEVSYA